MVNDGWEWLSRLGKKIGPTLDDKYAVIKSFVAKEQADGKLGKLHVVPDVTFPYPRSRLYD